MIEKDSLPRWIHQLASPDPLQNFKTIFQKKILDSTLDEFITIFGRANQSRLSSFLPTSIVARVQKQLSLREMRVNQLLPLTLKDLSHDCPLNVHRLDALYQNSVFKTETIREQVLKEIAHHLLSQPMPHQECRRLRCCSIPTIKSLIETEENALIDLVSKLSQVLKRPNNELLTLSDELRLFKYTALRGYQSSMSWATLFFLWINNTQPQELQALRLQFRLLPLFPDPRPLIPPPFLTNETFQEFLAGQTLSFLFAHPKTLLPRLPEMEEEMKKRFIATIREQQDTVYFIDYLYRLRDDPGNNPFPVQDALKELHVLISDRSTFTYSFLHACVHFFHCMLKFSIDQSHAALLFEGIYHLTEQEKSFYDQPIFEPFQIESFPINEIFLPYAKEKRLSTEEIVHIVLRYSVTVSGNEETSPYLNFQDHIVSLKEVEQRFNLRLPTRIVADLLFFQTMTSSIKDCIQTFASIRSQILANWLDTLALPYTLYFEWLQGGASVLDAIESQPKTEFSNGINPRLSDYSFKIGAFISLLQFATYPMPLSCFSDSMPIGIVKNTFIFSEKGIEEQNDFKPIHHDYPNGFVRRCHWFLDPNREEPCFFVCLRHFIDNPKEERTFQVPLEISLQKPWIETFLKLIPHFIDSFGKESLSEEEEIATSKMAQKEALLGEMNETNYLVPDELLLMKKSPEDLFDAFLAISPLLNHVWEQHVAIFGEEAHQVKSALYTFIQRLRSSFKKAFFSLPSGEWFKLG